MHDLVPSEKKQHTEPVTRPRKLNERIAKAKNEKPQRRLFDDFWREGELALMFGCRTAKSVLAVQVVEAIARGSGIPGFVMPTGRQKVLYVDLKLSDRQIAMRFSQGSGKHRFSENFFHDAPARQEDLVKWLRDQITEHGFRVVVIDDISSLSLTADGTRETLPVMRDLRQIVRETGISILVLAGAAPPRDGRMVDEADLMRSRILCDAADSVFAVAPHQRQPGAMYMMQTRSASGPIVWTDRNGPVFKVIRDQEGVLKLQFDERFKPEIREDLRQLVCNVKWRRDAGASFREIASELGISKSHAVRLAKRWTPAMDPPESEFEVDEDMLAYERRLQEKAAAGRHRQEAAARAEAAQAEEAREWPPDEPEADPLPYPADDPRNDVAHLKRSIDREGREIFIEQENERGRPVLWYGYNKAGRFSVFKRDGFGVTIRAYTNPHDRDQWASLYKGACGPTP